MSFQILDSNNVPVVINALDIEAAEFWNKPVDKKQYANPRPLTGNEFDDAMACSTNWFDMIGYNIHKPEIEGYGDSWIAVKMSMFQVCFNYDLYDYFGTQKDHKTVEAVEKRIQLILNRHKPYFDLIDHWQSKGYKPKQIKD